MAVHVKILVHHANERESQNHIRLQPANPPMKPVILHNHEITILGVVDAVIRKYRYR